MRPLIQAVFMMCIAVSASGQGTTPAIARDKPLTNEDVLAMIRGGMGESTVIAAIEHAPSESLDTSVDAVNRLIKQGVSKPVIDTMVKRAAQRGKTSVTNQAPVQSPDAKKAAVWIAGVGDAQFLQPVLDGLTDFLSAKKIVVKQMEGETKSRSSYLEQVSAAGGESLLYLSLDLTPHAFKHYLKAQCYEPGGKLLWEQQVSVLGMKGGSSDANSLLEKLEKELEPRIGKQGLSLAEVSTAH